MKIILMCVLVLSLFSGVSNAWFETLYDTVQTNYDNGSRKEFTTRFWFTSNDNGFRPHGQKSFWYENGQLRMETYYYKAFELGASITWDDIGGRLQEVSYLNGKPHGQFIAWHTDRSVKTCGYYKTGNKHGLWTYCKAGDDFNNSNLHIDSGQFWFEGTCAVRLCGPQGEKADSITYLTDVDSPWRRDKGSYYNEELGLHIEWNHYEFYRWKSDKTYFDVGNKVDGKKHGKWTRLNHRGEIIDIFLYKNGELITVDE